MRRFPSFVLAALLLAAAVPPADVHAGPDPAKLKIASESFGAGAKAFDAGRFAEAADHFEAADAAVPGEKALSLAIKARRNAGQEARAATLAALALERYGKDPAVEKLASEVISSSATKLHRVEVSCASLCILAVGSKLVHGEASLRWTLFLDPGKVAISASFLGNLKAPEQTVDAKAGGSSKVRFVPSDGPIGGGGSSAGGSSAGGSSAGGSSAGGDSSGGSSSGGSDASGGSGGEGGEGGGTEQPGEKKDFRIHPAFFFVGLGITVGLGATSIWSGIDTINEPGVDRVRTECRGLGEECALYQETQNKEVRTNALIGATAGVGVVTIILGAVGKWSSGEEEPPASDDTKTSLVFDPPRLWVDVDDAKGTQEVFLELGGRF
jgi:hypothetical protein